MPVTDPGAPARWYYESLLCALRPSSRGPPPCRTHTPARRPIKLNTVAYGQVHQHGWQPLEVVEMHEYRGPKNGALWVMYEPARRLADMLQVRHWLHHLRAFNHMADAAANIAMDTTESSQVQHPRSRANHVTLAAQRSSDFAHWQDSHFACSA